MSLEFGKSQPMTLGTELELQILNRDTFELSSSSPLIFKNLDDCAVIKAEIYQSMIEITTGICQSAHQVKSDLHAAFLKLSKVCKKLNLCLASAGTHPTAIYQDSLIFPGERYKQILRNHHWMAKRLLIFGLHVHVGMRSGDHAIQTTNALFHYLPLFLALSASSPFYKGDDTKMASSRITFFEALPTGGHPYAFNSWAEFKEVYSTLLKSGSISSPKDLWWDIRPSPVFGTIEIRICDSPATLSECAAIVALVHLICQKIDHDILDGRIFNPPPDWLMRENKWRVARDGVQANLIVNEEGETKSVTAILEETLRDLDALVVSHGYEDQVSILKHIVAYGSSAERQRLVYQNSHKLSSVSESLVQELNSDLPNWDFGREVKAI